MQLDIGSAKNTPITPNAPMLGRSMVSGTTIIIFLKSEKNIAYLALPSATNVD